MSGVSSLCYWSATFCWDFINYMVPGFIMIILFAAFSLDEFDGELGPVFLLIVSIYLTRKNNFPFFTDGPTYEPIMVN